MKLKTSKVMANLLNEKMKEKGLKYNITQMKLTEKQFSFYVDIDSYLHTQDFDYKTEKFNVIAVEYPLGYFANTKFLTTKDLTKIYNTSDKTFNGFLDSFKDYVEI